jgi:divalent metal cation (Fe/Co/Zn/Cd) transporter
VRQDPAFWAAQARRLAWITLFYNLAEASASAWYGWSGHSLALLGFGGDSLIEAASAVAVLWSFQRHLKPDGEGRGRSAQKLIGVLLLALALYLAISAYFEFRSGRGPVESAPAVWISLISLAVMLWLYRGKAACAEALQSPALRADAFCTLSCMWLSGLLLAGSAVLAGTHILWFDALTTLGMAVLIAREGIEEYDESEGFGGHDGHAH